jgi:hypothetical protein
MAQFRPVLHGAAAMETGLTSRSAALAVLMLLICAIVVVSYG